MALPKEARPVLQVLRWGSLTQERLSPPDTQFATTGRRIYVSGDIDGRFRARSNPYDLHAFGKPQPDDPLAYKLQGVWAQPVKGFSRYGYSVDVNGERWLLEGAERFTQAVAYVQFDFRRGALHAVRRDFAALDMPLLFSTLTLHNDSAEPLDLRAAFTAEFDLEDAWFTNLAEQRNQDETVSIEAGRLVACSLALPDGWAAAAGGLRPADETLLLDGGTGELVYHLQLLPGAEETLVFGMAVESQSGAEAALELLERWLPRYAEILAQKQSLYDDLLSRGPRLITPDPALNAAFDLARANLQMLEADPPSLGRCFFAGLDIFPFWFSNDGAYSAAGLLASGLRESALNHIRIGSRYLDQGRVPHQISPSGRLAFPGNAQETPLWVMSIWDAFRWTGDRAFLEEVYPGALTGMFDYVLGSIDPDNDGYPSGPGMVEVEGMGAEKLDSAAYTWSALLALAQMAEVLGDDQHARKAREAASRIASRFDADWWDETGGTYAMSLEDPGNRRYPVPHWAVIVPLEVGLATAGHAARTFATLREHYLNRWGLKHTVGEDERVWTLPTATLSRAAFRYGEPQMGLEMLKHITDTLEVGSIGLFHELIPEGACFIQLWSGATYLRGVIEDLLGIVVDAAGHRLCISPRVPSSWGNVVLENLSFGEHRVTCRFEPGAVTVNHLAGTAPLVVEYQLLSGRGAAGEIDPGKRVKLV